LENELELNKIVDKIIEDVENALTKLEGSLSNESKDEKRDSISTTNEKHPFPSIRYPTDNGSILKKKENEQAKLKSEDMLQRTEVIFHEQVIDGPEKLKKPTGIIEDFEFIDIKTENRLIHIFGPPSSGKTTFALQTAIEILPKNTYYIMTSHATSTMKRIKQMISEERWKENKNFNQHFFPIQIYNLEELISQIEKISTLHPEEVDLVVIDHFTDYIRGEIHKEEIRNLLRDILEKLYHLVDEKNAKIYILNGFSYKDSAPAEDIVESFCDMTIQFNKKDQNCSLLIESDNSFLVSLNNSGISNLHINIYF